jgi:hypothetical protein
MRNPGPLTWALFVLVVLLVIGAILTLRWRMSRTAASIETD